MRKKVATPLEAAPDCHHAAPEGWDLSCGGSPGWGCSLLPRRRPAADVHPAGAGPLLCGRTDGRAAAGGALPQGGGARAEPGGAAGAASGAGPDRHGGCGRGSQEWYVCWAGLCGTKCIQRPALDVRGSWAALVFCAAWRLVAEAGRGALPTAGRPRHGIACLPLLCIGWSPLRAHHLRLLPSPQFARMLLHFAKAHRELGNEREAQRLFAQALKTARNVSRERLPGSGTRLCRRLPGESFAGDFSQLFFMSNMPRGLLPCSPRVCPGLAGTGCLQRPGAEGAGGLRRLSAPPAGGG